MIVRNQEVTATGADPGVTRKIMSYAPGMMAAEMQFAKGAVGAMHSHPHEQIGYVVSGRFELTLDGAVHAIATGDTYYVRPDALHGVVALEDGLLLDVFCPMREDFLK